MKEFPLPQVMYPVSFPTPSGGLFWSDEFVPSHDGLSLCELTLQSCWVDNGSQLYLDKLKDCKLVVDLGACSGAFSLFACSLDPDIKVLAVESNPRNFALLVKNIRANGLVGRIFPVNVGVYSEKGNAYTIDNITGSWIRPDEPRPANQSTFDVRLVTLEDLFSKYEIDRVGFMKVDIEGCEFPVFETVSTEILELIDNVSIECHTWGPFDRLELRRKLVAKLSLTHDILHPDRLSGMVEASIRAKPL